MDSSAVIYCLESFLMELWLTTKGHLDALYLVCKREKKKRGKIRTWRRENNI